MKERVIPPSLAIAAAWLNQAKPLGLLAGPLGPLVLLTDDARLPDPRPALAGLPRGGSIILRSTKAIDEGLARAILQDARRHTLKLLIAQDVGLAHRIGADGAHLPSAMLGALPVLKRLYPRLLFSAACHNGRDLRLAAQGGADAAFLSPLFSTQSHPGSAALGVTQARLLLKDARIPVYGLGGINAKTAGRLISLPLCGFGAIDGLGN